ncbi:MAG: hypothetical protein IPK74_04520 [Deltaproteobacteria bacterium]|nr:hypothetical protein [Deltaproteobacteria bacterium]
MTISRTRTRSLRSPLAALALVAVLGTPALAFAGEVKFGTEALAVDGEGKLTDAGRAAAKDEIPSAPGEELWVAHLWAKLDKPAPGGLNVEFFGELDGKRYLAHRHVEASFDGGKYLSLELELEGSDGFNKNKSYDVEITQEDDKGRHFKLAAGKIKLGWTPAPKEDPKADGDDDDGEEPEADSAAQDALDTISGGGDGGGDGATGAPPPVEPKKKGCSIDGDAGVAPLGLVVLLAFANRRRRR